MELPLQIALIGAGLVNLAPIVAAFAPRLIQRLYGVQIEDETLLILLRHRALLLGVIGGLLILAAFDHTLYNAAVAAGLMSMIAYIIITVQHPHHQPQIRRVALVDVIAAVALAAAYGVYALT